MIFLPRSAPESALYVTSCVTGSTAAIFVGSPSITGHPGTGVPSSWNAYTCMSFEPTTSSRPGWLLSRSPTDGIDVNDQYVVLSGSRTSCADQSSQLGPIAVWHPGSCEYAGLSETGQPGTRWPRQFHKYTSPPA